MVLSFILIQNRQGKTRLAKWYAPYTDEEKVKLKGEVRQHPTLYRTPADMPGPPTHRPSRPEVPVQLRRVPLSPFILVQSSFLTSCPTESFQHEDRVQAVCRPLLLRLC